MNKNKESTPGPLYLNMDIVFRDIVFRDIVFIELSNMFRDKLFLDNGTICDDILAIPYQEIY